MAKHMIMDHTGHSVVEYDLSNDAQVAEAMARFEALIKEGKTAATRKAGETDYSVIKRADQQQDETLFVPHMQGG